MNWQDVPGKDVSVIDSSYTTLEPANLCVMLATFFSVIFFFPVFALCLYSCFYSLYTWSIGSQNLLTIEAKHTEVIRTVSLAI